jgi:hypothetical protein
VLLTVNMTLEGKEVPVTQAVSTRNLKLTKEILLSKAEEASAFSSGSKLGAGPSSSEEHHKDLKHVVGDSAPADVNVEDKWKSLLADGDELNKCMWLRRTIATGLQALFEVMPKYSEKDFIMVNRKTDKGLWKSELWAKRDFEPLEIQLAPFSSQIKDTHLLMVIAHAVVTIPKHGRGSHPTNGSLALDGRSRSLIARSGVVDNEEHHGSLFWVITRTSETKEVNLDLDNSTWSHNIKMNLPAPKKRKAEVIEWEPSELPSFPILVSKKAIQKKTKLCVYMPKQTKDKAKPKEEE